jgi:DNA-binding NtrC family response regulator
VLESAARQSVSGKKILLVDDDELVRQVCEAVLSREGYQYLVAINGLEAIEIYRNHQEDICLVLSDVLMPVRGGVELFYDILQLNPHANVILMSGYSAVDVVPDELKKLCSMMSKPFTPLELIESVQKCLRYDEHPRVIETSSC